MSEPSAVEIKTALKAWEDRHALIAMRKVALLTRDTRTDLFATVTALVEAAVAGERERLLSRRCTCGWAEAIRQEPRP